MHKHQKYVNALFFVAALIMWLMATHYLKQMVASFSLQRKLGSTGVDLIEIGLPLVFAVATFAGLRANAKTHNFVADAVGELALVSWPTQKETRLGTIVVIVTVLLAGLILGLIDLGFMSVVKTIINA